MKYLALFIWHGDDNGSWSMETIFSDKENVVSSLLKESGHNSLDNAEIIVIENGSMSGFKSDWSLQSAPKVLRHWSAANGDFDGM